MGNRHHYVAVLLYCVFGLSSTAFAQCPPIPPAGQCSGSNQCDQGQAWAYCQAWIPGYNAYRECTQSSVRAHCEDYVPTPSQRAVVARTTTGSAAQNWAYSALCSDRPDFVPATEENLPELICHNGCEYETKLHISITSSGGSSSMFNASALGDVCVGGDDPGEGDPEDTPCVETPNGLVCGDKDKICAESESGIVCVDYDDAPDCDGPLCVSEPDTDDPPTKEPPEPTDPPDPTDDDDEDGTSSTSDGPPPICSSGATCNFNWTHNGSGDGGGGEEPPCTGEDCTPPGGGGEEPCTGEDCEEPCIGEDCEEPCTGPDCDDNGSGQPGGGSGCVGPDCDPGTGECTGPNCTPCQGEECGGECQGPNCGGGGDCDPATEDCGEEPGGECDPATENCDNGQASGGATCAAPPSCSGDAIGCMVAYQAWRTSCEVQELREIFDGEDAENLDGNAQDRYSADDINSTLLDTSGFLGGGGCPANDVTITMAGTTASVTPHWCEFLPWLGWLVVAAATVAAARIIGGA